MESVTAISKKQVDRIKYCFHKKTKEFQLNISLYQ